MESINLLRSSPSTPFSSSSIITTKPRTHQKPKPIKTQNFTKLTTSNLKTHHYPFPTRRFTTKKPTLPPLQSSSSSSNGEEEEEAFNGSRLIVQVGEALSLGLPILVGSATVLALWKPSTFLWVDRNLQIFGLTVTMLGMGMTLTLDDLKTVLLMPKQLLAGFFLQYTIMPLSGFFVSKLLNLPSYYAAGLILVGCCPGGTASNVVTYLARGNVALSVLMTAASTFAAAIMTPLLTSKLAGQFVSVDRAGLFISTVQVVLAPVLLGAVLNQYFNNLVKVVSPLMPLIAVTSVSILCGSAIAQNAPAILASGLQVVVAVFSLHGAGFFLGYVFSRILGIDDSSSRTISIEVGMQNSLLGLVLANQHFGNPLTAVPCAVSSLCHLIYGSALAGIWRYFPPAKDGKDWELRSGDVTVS